MDPEREGAEGTPEAGAERRRRVAAIKRGATSVNAGRSYLLPGLWACRLAAGLTQRQLAGMIGGNAATVRELERGRRGALREARREEDREGCTSRGIPLPALRQLRRGRGLSQRELGRLAGVSAGTVYRLEKGIRGAYPVTVTKLARALKVPPAELMRGHRRE